jgi:cell division protease FtsH
MPIRFHMVSIISRRAVFGYTITHPTEDKFMVKKKEIMDKLSHMLAGRVAEEIRFDDITTGASNDLQRRRPRLPGAWLLSTA